MPTPSGLIRFYMIYGSKSYYCIPRYRKLCFQDVTYVSLLMFPPYFQVSNFLVPMTEGCYAISPCAAADFSDEHVKSMWMCQLTMTISKSDQKW